MQATTLISTKGPSNASVNVSKAQNTSLPTSALKPTTTSSSTTAPTTTRTPTPTFIPSTTLSTIVHNKNYGNIPSGISIKSSFTVTKSTIIFLSATLGPFMGVLLFTFVYRCTPIGSWLGNHRSKKKKYRKKRNKCK